MSNDFVPELEVISNGSIVKRIPCRREPHQKFDFTLNIEEQGWFLIRAVTDVEHTFRFASTAPWFVNEADEESRVSKTSAQFFLDWVEQRIGRVKANVTDPKQLREVLEPHEAAYVFWKSRVAQANSE